MAEKTIRPPNLKQSTNIVIGGRAYTSEEISSKLIQQAKYVQASTVTDYQPREIRKSLVNESGVIKTGLSQEIKTEKLTPSIQQPANTAFKYAQTERSPEPSVQPTPVQRANDFTSIQKQDTHISGTHTFGGNITGFEASRLQSQISNAFISNQNMPHDIQKAVENESGVIKTTVPGTIKTDYGAVTPPLATYNSFNGSIAGFVNNYDIAKIKMVLDSDYRPRYSNKPLENQAGVIKTEAIPLRSFESSHTSVMPAVIAGTIPSSTGVVIGKSNPDISNLKLSADNIYLPRGINKAVASESGTIKTALSVSPVKTDIAVTKPLPQRLAYSNDVEDRREKRDYIPEIVAGSVKGNKSEPLGVTFFSSAMITGYNSSHLKTDISNIKTGGFLEKATQARALQATYDIRFNPSSLIKSASLEAKASFYESLAANLKGHGKSDLSVLDNTLGNSAREVIGKAQSVMQNSNDTGTQLAGGAISASIAAYSGFKLAQGATPYIIGNIRGVINAGKGAIDVVTTAGRATVTVNNTFAIARNLSIPINSKSFFNVMLNQASITGLNRTATSKAILHGVQKVQTGLTQIKGGVVSSVNAVKGAATTTIHVVRGITNGTIKTSVVAHSVLTSTKNAVIHGLKKSGQAVVRGGIKGVVRVGVKGATWSAVKGVPKATIGIGKLTLAGAGALSKTDNIALQGIGNGITVGHRTIKTAYHVSRVSGRAVKTSVKGAYKTTKTVWKAISYVREKGLRAAWEKAGQMAGQAFIQAGKSIVNLVINLVKAAGQKLILPLILIVCAVTAVSGILTAPLQAVGAIFGSIFSIFNGDESAPSYTDSGVREYTMNTTDGIPVMKADFINSLVSHLDSELKAHGGSYDLVELYSNHSSGRIDINYSSIDSAMYSDDDIANIITPIYNAVILQKYDLTPTSAQAHDTLKEIFDTLFYTSEEDSAVLIRDVDSDGTVSWDTLSLLKATLSIDGIYQLLEKYFTDPIDQLLNLSSRTSDQENELQALKDYYEICLEYINELGTSFDGHGMALADLASVSWVAGSRSGNNAIINLALTQLGEAGGQPYWSWLGFASRVEWCACFVSWCFYTNGDEAIFGSKSSSCSSLSNSFKSRGVWKNGGYTDLAPGDVIFFDWDHDGEPNHVGLVIGRDEDKVYTVEGNNGDAVRAYSYSLSSSVIYGYGLLYH